MLGAYLTVFPVMVAAWSWKVAVAFLIGYLFIGYYKRLMVLAVMVYLSTWGFIWWTYVGAFHRALVRSPDVVMKVLNLTIPTFLAFVLLGLMITGFPWNELWRKRTRKASNSKAEKSGERDDATESINQKPRDISFDPYRVLGLSPLASQVEVEAGFKREIALYHPDKVAHLGDDLKKVAHERTLEIQRAFEALSSK